MTSPTNIMEKSNLLNRARTTLATLGRVHMPGFFSEENAAALHAACLSTDWKLVLQGQGAVRELDAAAINALDDLQKRQLVEQVHDSARQNFQFMYDCFRISDAVESGALQSGPFFELQQWLNSEAGLAQLRAITGEPAIGYVDSQATRYGPGHFLTTHDDDTPGKDRLFAYVINLTPEWRADWGGLLQFMAADDHVAESYVPRWNALNVFRVPQRHAVSYVTPFAAGSRYSITGWMRRKPN